MVSITEYDVSEDRIWSLFNYVFSNSSRKRNTYKFGLVKSLLDNVFMVSRSQTVSILHMRSCLDVLLKIEG